MTIIEHDTDARLADFLAEWNKRLQENEVLAAGFWVFSFCEAA